PCDSTNTRSSLKYTLLQDTHSHYTLFFFFYSSGHPRDLHSFPTRRSSDLRHPTRPRADARVLPPRFAGLSDSHISKTKAPRSGEDRKSTRLNSSHVKISYAVFCLKKKKKNKKNTNNINTNQLEYCTH